MEEDKEKIGFHEFKMYKNESNIKLLLTFPRTRTEEILQKDGLLYTGVTR